MTAEEAGSAHILIVEDSETQALQLRHMLEGQGFRVSWAASAEAAMERMHDHLPDLVIADYHLPGMNGDGLARQMRMNPRSRAIPVLILTGAREAESERQGLESGADAYMAKSSDPGPLVLRIRALLRGHAAPGHQPAPTSNDADSFRRPMILLVNDRPVVRVQIEQLLAREGYEVRSIADVEEAYALVEANPRGWDVVIVNMLTTAYEAGALCRRLDAYRLASALPTGAARFAIVALGSDHAGSEGTLGEAFAAGADDLIPITAHPDVLGLRIRNIVRRKRLQDETHRAEAESADRERAIERAKAEAQAAEAKASLAEALSHANSELEEANHKLRDTQAQLVQAAKMASLGELVAGIAHEINNPLAFLLAHQGTVERVVGELRAREDLGEDAGLRKVQDRVGSMRVGLQRIQELVLNLRKFSRLDEGQFQTVDVPESIATVLALLDHKLGERITVERDFQAVPGLYCAPALLNQVVMNIVGNAADAIVGEGVIRIATRSDDDIYEIAISDSGPGVPPDLADRVFEPFFTTKPVGAGTGLGLAIAYSVVQAHKGDINIDRSSLGGAGFVIRIPRRDIG